MQEILAHRDRHLKMKRQQHFDLLMKQQRALFHRRLQEQERVNFMALYPRIDEGNYQQYRGELVEYAVNPDYSYQLLVFVPIIYEYLMENPRDGASITLLKFLSQYEDIQVPQTQQLAEFLLQLAEDRVHDCVVICANLLSYGRYASVLRDRLLAVGLYDRLVQGVGADEEMRGMLVEMYCSLLVSQPMLEIKVLQHALHTLVKLITTQQQKWCLFSTFPQLRSRALPHPGYARLLLQTLHPLLLSLRHSHQAQLTSLLLYCALGSTYTTSRPLLSHTLVVPPVHSHALVEDVCYLLVLYIEADKYEYTLELIESIVEVFSCQSSTLKTKYNCLRVLNCVDDGELRAAVQGSDSYAQFVAEITQMLGHDWMAGEVLEVLLTLFQGADGVVEMFGGGGGRRVLEGLLQGAAYGGQLEQLLAVMDQVEAQH